jgi:hypothetical protein
MRAMYLIFYWAKPSVCDEFRYCSPFPKPCCATNALSEKDDRYEDEAESAGKEEEDDDVGGRGPREREEEEDGRGKDGEETAAHGGSGTREQRYAPPAHA